MVEMEPPQAVWYHLALSWCTMVSEVEVRHARGQNIHCPRHHYTPHSWLTAKVIYLTNSTKRFYWLPAKVMYSTNSTKRCSWLPANVICPTNSTKRFSWLPTKVMYPTNSTKRFFWLTGSTEIFAVVERSNLCRFTIDLIVILKVKITFQLLNFWKNAQMIVCYFATFL